MSLLDTLYRYEKNPTRKGKSRRDLVAHGPLYGLLHRPNKSGDYCIYLGNDTGFIKANRKRRGSHAITLDGDFVSSIYKDPAYPQYGYGDIKGSQDAVILVLSGDDFEIVELFIAKGKKSVSQNLLSMLIDGELAEEMEELRKNLKTFQSKTAEPTLI